MELKFGDIKKMDYDDSLPCRLRKQAYANLTFIGVWSGYWFTVIDGTPYRSDEVSGFKYIVNDTGTFIQDAIISHCRKIRKKN